MSARLWQINFCRKSTERSPSLLLIQRGYSITDWEELFKKFRGEEDRHNCYTGVIIDEFLPLTNLKSYNKGRILLEFSMMGINEMILISTPDKMYNRLNNDDCNEMIQRFLLSNDKENFELIKTDFDRHKHDPKLDGLREVLGEERYKLDVLGEYLIELNF